MIPLDGSDLSQFITDDVPSAPAPKAVAVESTPTSDPSDLSQYVSGEPAQLSPQQPDDTVQLDAEDIATAKEGEQSWMSSGGSQGLITKGLGKVTRAIGLDIIPEENSKKPSQIISPEGKVSRKELLESDMSQEAKAKIVTKLLAKEKGINPSYIREHLATMAVPQESDSGYTKIGRHVQQLADNIVSGLGSKLAKHFEELPPVPSWWKPVPASSEADMESKLANGLKEVDIYGMKVPVEKGDTLEVIKNKSWEQYVRAVFDEADAATRSGKVENLGFVSSIGASLAGKAPAAIVSPLTAAIEKAGPQALKDAIARNPVIGNVLVNVVENGLMAAPFGTVQDVAVAGATGGVFGGVMEGGKKLWRRTKGARIADQVRTTSPEVDEAVSNGNFQHPEILAESQRTGVPPEQISKEILKNSIADKAKPTDRNAVEFTNQFLKDAATDPILKKQLDLLHLMEKGVTVEETRILKSTTDLMRDLDAGSGKEEVGAFLKSETTKPLFQNAEAMRDALNKVKAGAGDVFYNDKYVNKRTAARVYEDEVFNALGNAVEDEDGVMRGHFNRPLNENLTRMAEAIVEGNGDLASKQKMLNGRLINTKADVGNKFMDIVSTLAGIKSAVDPKLYDALDLFRSMVNDAGQAERRVPSQAMRILGDIKSGKWEDPIDATILATISDQVSKYNDVVGVLNEVESKAVKFQDHMSKLDPKELALRRKVTAPPKSAEWLVVALDKGTNNESVGAYLDAVLSPVMKDAKGTSAEGLVTRLKNIVQDAIVKTDKIPDELFAELDNLSDTLKSVNFDTAGIKDLKSGMALYNKEYVKAKSLTDSIQLIAKGNEDLVVPTMVNLTDSVTFSLNPFQNIANVARADMLPHWMNYLKDTPLSSETKLALWRVHSGDMLARLKSGDVIDGVLSPIENVEHFVQASRAIPEAVLVQAKVMYAKRFGKPLNTELFISSFITPYNGQSGWLEFHTALTQEPGLMNAVNDRGAWLENNNYMASKLAVATSVMGTEVRIADRTGIDIASHMENMSSGTKTGATTHRDLIYRGEIVQRGIHDDIVNGRLREPEIIKALHRLDGTQGMAGFFDRMKKDGSYMLDASGVVFKKLTTSENDFARQLAAEGGGVSRQMFLEYVEKTHPGLMKDKVVAQEVIGNFYYLRDLLQHDKAWWDYVWKRRRDVLDIDHRRYQIENEIADRKAKLYGYRENPPHWREQYVRGEVLNRDALRTLNDMYLRDPDATMLFGSDKAGQLAKAQQLPLATKELIHPFLRVSDKALRGIVKAETIHSIWRLQDAAVTLKNLGFTLYSDFANRAAQGFYENAPKHAGNVAMDLIRASSTGRTALEVGDLASKTVLGTGRVAAALANPLNNYVNMLQAKLTSDIMTGKWKPSNLFIPGLYSLFTSFFKAGWRMSREIAGTFAETRLGLEDMGKTLKPKSHELVGRVLEQYKDAADRSKYARFVDTAELVGHVTKAESFAGSVNGLTEKLTDFAMDSVKEPSEVATSRWVLDEGMKKYERIVALKVEGASKEAIYEAMKKAIPNRPLAEAWNLAGLVHGKDPMGIAGETFLKTYHLEGIGRYGALATPMKIVTLGRFIPSLTRFYPAITNGLFRWGNLIGGAMAAAKESVGLGNMHEQGRGMYALAAITLPAVSVGMYMLEYGWGDRGTEKEDAERGVFNRAARRGLLGWTGLGLSRMAPLSQVVSVGEAANKVAKGDMGYGEAIATLWDGLFQGARYQAAPSPDFWNGMRNAKRLYGIVDETAYKAKRDGLIAARDEAFAAGEADKMTDIENKLNELETQNAGAQMHAFVEYAQRKAAIPFVSDPFAMQLITPAAVWYMLQESKLQNDLVSYANEPGRFRVFRDNMRVIGWDKYFEGDSYIFNSDMFYQDAVANLGLPESLAKKFAEELGEMTLALEGPDTFLGASHTYGWMSSKLLDRSKENAKTYDPIVDKPHKLEPYQTFEPETGDSIKGAEILKQRMKAFEKKGRVQNLSGYKTN